ncbi:MAG: radical SAM protein [Dehalococcoidia bacterium]
METPASYGTGRPRTEFREEPCKSALNRVRGMGFGWSLNPYMGCAHRCTFCYVRNFERRADRPSGEAYGTSIRVKTNVVEVLRRELGRRGWRREVVAIGAATDPYQPAEGRYRLTRGCLEALSGARTPVQLITRGPMVVRDLDVLQGFAGRAALEVNFSIPTLDVEVWRRTEPGTAPPRQRLRALERLAAAGVRVGVGMAPLLPGLSDRPQQLAAVVRAARDAGASHVWANVLHLQPGTREHFLEQLGRDWPEERARYEAMYGPRGYVAASVAEPVLERVARLRERYGVGERGASSEAEAGEGESREVVPRQLALFG